MDGRTSEGVAITLTDTAPPPETRLATDRVPGRRKAALRLAQRLYARELRRRPLLTGLALLLPALGSICLHYLPPLVVAALVGVADKQADGRARALSFKQPR